MTYSVEPLKYHFLQISPTDHRGAVAEYQILRLKNKTDLT